VCFVGRLLGLCPVSAAEQGFALRRRELEVPDGQPPQPNSVTLKKKAANFYETWEQ
jgi:hypothetical protein